MPINLDANVGKILVALDVNFHTSPALRAIYPPDTDPETVARDLRRALEFAIQRTLGDVEYPFGSPDIKVHPTSGEIKTADERRQEDDDNKRQLRAACAAGEAARNEEMRNDPHNGTEGWWFVSGVRHRAIVRASSAPEAIEKAASRVQDWEGPDASWIGETLPDVVEC